VNRPGRLRIEAMLDDALRVYRANQADHADPVSIAFDAGRVDGIKQVLRAIETQDAARTLKE